MPKQYSPKNFFRQAPNYLLQQYFSARQVLSEVDFASLTETKIDPIYDAWLALPEDTRNQMEQDFQEIDELANEGGSKAILDEANYHEEALAVEFAKLKGFHEHAFWTFLNRPKYWNGALAFHHADTRPSSYWRKRKNLPRKPAAVDLESVAEFEKGLSSYFHTMQGRGRNCKVDCYRRGELDYFFAYPEDYAQASIEWQGKEFKRRPHHPAFEIIFVYSRAEGTLEIYLSGDRKPIPDLQTIFAQVILKENLGPDEEDERIYDLNPFKSRNFHFVYGPESGIVQVLIKKLRLTIHHRKDKIVLEVDPSLNPHAVFDLLDKITKEIPWHHLFVTQVGIKVLFQQNPSSKKANARSFEISWPNSCSLKHNDQDLIIRKLLADSNIEPREPVQEEEVA